MCMLFSERLVRGYGADYMCAQEVLAQLEEKERLEKLEETFHSVYEDYRRILEMMR
jgi:hypothetical protein